MKNPFLYRVEDSMDDQPGRADGARRIGGPSSLSLARIEGKGATLITSHWMAAFSNIGETWAGDDFERRIRKTVREEMASDRFEDGPGAYRIWDHCPSDWAFFVNRKNNFGSRCKVEFECLESEESADAQLTIPPFDPRLKLRKPRHCSHFRILFGLGAMCDFEYSAKNKCYEPVRPELLGLQDLAFSEYFPVNQPLADDLVFEVGWSSSGHELCERSRSVIAIGIEFWYFGRTAPDGRLVDRVVMLG
jgi:hypothetical protein